MKDSEESKIKLYDLSVCVYVGHVAWMGREKLYFEFWWDGHLEDIEAQMRGYY
jgi:hypothetical protein